MTPIPSFIYKKSNQIAMIVFVPIFALVFILIYRPFDFDKIGDTDLFAWLQIPRELSIQLITVLMILVGMAVVAISRTLMAIYTRRRPISYVKYIIWVFLEIVIMALIYTVAAMFTDTPKSVVEIFRNSLVKTILVLFIPYVMCYIYFIWRERVAQLKSLRERIAEDETVLQNAYVQIYDEKNEMRLSIRRENLIMIESADNYVCVWYLNNNAPKKTLVRNTLKRVAEQLVKTSIIRCHRSYMINIDIIKVLRREKEGLFVEFGIEGVPDVPISKTYSEAVQAWLTR
ncbi:MAG: LytTR family transcriptional regulator DNA-binding domain-containing protein [Alistipes sp.]|nr:LytTR family transcriptional regulator DNA-binding domain-containing protein [Alistipes sp.]